MGVQGLDWQTVNLALGAGMFTKDDPRFSSPPALDVARDVQFELLGGLQTRLPFAAMSNAIFGGGTLSNCRFLAVVNGELCVFTDTALYSWNAQQSAWVLRGTHLSASVSETQRFATSGDQIDSDRAELNGTVVFAWAEGTQAYAAALDKTTGSVLVSPTTVGTSVGRPRLVTLSTKILLLTDGGGNNLVGRSIDPAAPGTAISGGATPILATNYNAYYDAARVPGADAAIVVARRTTTTSYSILKVTAALAVSSATPARTCDGPVAVAVDPTGTNLQVVRANGTNIQGDLVTVSGLADVLTGQAIGTAATAPVNQVAVEYSSVKVGGQYVATAWWSAGENGGTSGFACKTNTVDQAGAIGSAKTMPAWLGLASRAFEYSGSVYAWLVFAGDSTVSGTGSIAGFSAQLQNTYFLYRSDGFLVAKAATSAAGGFSPSTGHLSAVSLIGPATFAWCGAIRRVIQLGGSHSGYADRDPDDIVVTFDDNIARRSVQLGQTLYVVGGLPSQYDGAALTELGFLVFPWAFSSAPLGGAVPAGTYYYKCTLRWPNAQGEQERSTTATVGSFVNPGASKAALSIAALTVTRKTGSVRAPAVEPWRTVISPSIDSPFFLTSSKDPTAVGDNGYLANDAASGGFLTTFTDNFLDAVLQTKEANPENGTVLESLSPPPASFAFATDTRLFLGGVAGDPHRIWYSRERGDGEVASFNDALVVDVPPQGGAITSGWFQDDVLYVGRQYAVYAIPGVGFDNAGGGQNFGPARTVSLDVGPVSQEAQCFTPIGTVFKSAKGWYLLERGGSVKYIGGAAAQFDGDTVLAMHVITSRHQVRILTNNRLLLWDYRGAIDATNPDGIGQWAEWTIANGLHATIWNGTYVYLTATGPQIEQATYSPLTYGLDVETSWIKPADLQGYVRLRWMMLLGEYRSAHLLRLRVARDYQYDGGGQPAWFDDVAWSPTPALVGGPLQVRHTPSLSQCSAYKVRITAVAELARATLATATMAPQVSTNGVPWAATWQAASTKPGLMGNAVTMSVGAASFAAVSIPTLPIELPFAFASSTGLVDVRDHYSYNTAEGRWVEDINNIGVLVAGVVTVANLEAAIGVGSNLATLSIADASPSKQVAVASMLGSRLTATGAFSGGTYTSPTGEACRLTGLALQVGLKRGLFKRLPAEQMA